jgi:hypothetical protein
MTRGVERADEMRRSRRSFLAGNRAKGQSAELRRGAIAPCDKAPDQKDDDGAYDGTDQPRAFTGLIPADRLPDIGGDERPDDPRMVVRINPEGSLGPGCRNLAMTPATKPMMIVQRMLTTFSSLITNMNCATLASREARL